MFNIGREQKVLDGGYTQRVELSFLYDLKIMDSKRLAIGISGGHRPSAEMPL
jgi:hypothetical protein